MTRLVQLQRGDERRVAVVEEPSLVLLADCDSVYALAEDAIARNRSLPEIVQDRRSEHSLSYDQVYAGHSDWRLLSPADHPSEPARCLVSGTGLTHLGSAEDRNAMHAPADEEDITDSMKMFRWGLERGKPGPDEIGVSPEWFYKGDGTVLRAHNESLDLPPYALDGGEEAEIAGVYLIDRNGHPVRIGLALGNEYSDHLFEKGNYLNLASSKIRQCGLGPEIVIDPDFSSVPGEARIHRSGDILWEKEIITGEENMCHSLANIEHHHFKFASHRRPGDLHVHFLGACALSFGAGIKLQDGDIMEVSFKGYGRPLRNPLHHDGQPDHLVTVRTLS